MDKIKNAIGIVKACGLNIKGTPELLEQAKQIENTIIEALEKQGKKKVNNLEVFCDIGACIPKIKSGNCPICNNFMIGNHTYCNDCGQALDWESEVKGE